MCKLHGILIQNVIWYMCDVMWINPHCFGKSGALKLEKQCIWCFATENKQWFTKDHVIRCWVCFLARSAEKNYFFEWMYLPLLCLLCVFHFHLYGGKKWVCIMIGVLLNGQLAGSFMIILNSLKWMLHVHTSFSDLDQFLKTIYWWQKNRSKSCFLYKFICSWVQTCLIVAHNYGHDYESNVLSDLRIFLKEMRDTISAQQNL